MPLPAIGGHRQVRHLRAECRRTGELRKRGLRIALQEQPLRISSALLEQPGDVVSREELCQRLWPDGTFVDFEHSLNAAVRRLRVTLGDEADVPRFVETVHKRGYRFLALKPVPRMPKAGIDGRARAGDDRAHRAEARAACGAAVRPSDGFTDGLTEEAMTQLTQAARAQSASWRAPRSSVHIAKGAAQQKSAGRSAPPISSKGTCGAMATACGSRHSSSNRRKKRTCGRRRSTA